MPSRKKKRKRATHAPEPHVDPRHVELRRPHAATRAREARAEAVRLGLAHGAAGAVRAVRRAERARLLDLVRRDAPRGRVERHLVVVHEVDALDDVCVGGER